VNYIFKTVKIKYINSKIKAKGFTLIELIMVMAIIGILASIIMVNLNGMRKKALNAKMKMEANQIMKAIQTYEGYNGVYPLTQGTGTWWGFVCLKDSGTCADGLFHSDSTINSMLSPFFQIIPKTDLPSSNSNCIGYDSYLYQTSPHLSATPTGGYLMYPHFGPFTGGECSFTNFYGQDYDPQPGCDDLYYCVIPIGNPDGNVIF
jgi:prepilin-type N-terminal cleavage/methylation domain-containing protein